MAAVLLAFAALLILLIPVARVLVSPPMQEVSRLETNVTLPSLLHAKQLLKEIYVPGHEWPHAELCPYNGTGRRLLILIASPTHRFNARDKVRLTWGHYALRFDIVIAFVLGTPSSKLRLKLEKENKLFGDLIMGRFVDSDKNLTLKTVSMLEWAGKYCVRTPYILKTQDDEYVNVLRMISFINDTKRRSAERTMWGRKKCKYKPTLTGKGREKDCFICCGSYLLTGDLVVNLLAAAVDEPYDEEEDLFVTGVLGANKIGARLQHMSDFFVTNTTIQNISCCLTIHAPLFSHMMLDLWLLQLNEDNKLLRERRFRTRTLRN